MSEISEAARKTAEWITAPGYQGTDAIARREKIIQQAIDEVTAGKDATIAKLRARLDEVCDKADLGYYKCCPDCGFFDESDRWDVKGGDVGYYICRQCEMEVEADEMPADAAIELLMCRIADLKRELQIVKSHEETSHIAMMAAAHELKKVRDEKDAEVERLKAIAEAAAAMQKQAEDNYESGLTCDIVEVGYPAYKRLKELLAGDKTKDRDNVDAGKADDGE